VKWFSTTVCDDPSNVRGHPNLFEKLTRLLKERGAAHPGDDMVRRRDGTERHIGIGHIKIDDNQKVVVLVKDPPEMKKKTKWADRLKKVYNHAGKKVGDFAGSKSDIKWAINFGLIKVASAR
jgi:hypothetical protein